jgi:DNA-binding response OmpR family regulator
MKPKGMIMNKYIDTLLMVEDEEDHARIIRKALNVDGGLVSQIIWKTNGKAAMQYLLDSCQGNMGNLPGLILLDIKMPLKSGFEMLQELKSHALLRKIPVVMLTTTSSSHDVERALELGANDYIVKPMHLSHFIEKISKLGYYWSYVSDSAKHVNSLT